MPSHSRKATVCTSLICTFRRLRAAISRKGMTLVPLSLFFNARGLAKVSLGLAKGKNHLDRRDDIKKREWQRDQARIMRARG